ncbi:MCP four helix bundle domain-containing protein [Pseudoalteromonas sp. Z9A5]|uniref:CHASE3 domain-containing protein n=1 Tax=Pseudoalteromonas sp. Z9A5 TaxID=2686355 RepID=UPI0014080061|nr:MCP four helix bundle domain-containing protein [Pseudoalteromonas sp. Z9A5]
MLSFSKKLYLGFSFVLILLASVSITSYVALTSASSGFGDYRSLARAANAVGRVQANMLMVRMSMKDFIASSDEKDKQSFDSYFSKTEQFITEATTLIKNPEQSKKIKQVDVLLNQYNLAFEKVVTLKKERNKLVNDILNVKGALIEENLTKMLISAKNDGDISAAYNASLATRNLLLARVYALKFLASNMQSDAERVVK